MASMVNTTLERRLMLLAMALEDGTTREVVLDALYVLRRNRWAWERL